MNSENFSVNSPFPIIKTLSDSFKIKTTKKKDTLSGRSVNPSDSIVGGKSSNKASDLNKTVLLNESQRATGNKPLETMGKRRSIKSQSKKELQLATQTFVETLNLQETSNLKPLTKENKSVDPILETPNVSQVVE